MKKRKRKKQGQRVGTRRERMGARNRWVGCRSKSVERMYGAMGERPTDNKSEPGFAGKTQMMLKEIWALEGKRI